MNDQIFIALAAEEKGGLFDFGATLPLVAIEFLLLMFVLNLILYIKSRIHYDIAILFIL